MRTLVLLCIVLIWTYWDPPSCKAQSFTQTIGGLSAQDGIGAMPIPSGYLVGIRDHDPELGRHVGRSYRLSATGSLQSSFDLALTGSIFLQGMATAPDGMAFQFGSVLSRSRGQHQGLLVKYSDQGAVIWTALDSLSGNVQYFGATGMPNGGAVVCGLVEGPTGHDAVIPRAMHQMVNKSGSGCWRAFTDEEAYAVAVDGTDLIVTGRSENFSGTSDMLFARLDLSGEVVWTTSFGGSAQEGGACHRSSWEWPVRGRRLDHQLWRIQLHLELNSSTCVFGRTGPAGRFALDTFDRQCHPEHRAYALAIAPNGDLFTAGEVNMWAYGCAVPTIHFLRYVDLGTYCGYGQGRTLGPYPTPE